MPLKLKLPRQALDWAWSSAWSWVPPRAWVWVPWVLGLGVGFWGFRASLDLPLAGAAALWAGALALGALLALYAEPEIWMPAAQAPKLEPTPEPEPEPPAPPVPPAPRPLLDLVPLSGGVFRMGSSSATEAEIDEYVPQWAEVLGKEPREVRDQVKGWRQREEPAHRVRLAPFAMARTPLTRGQWRSVMAEAPEEWSADGSDERLPVTHLDWPQALACCNALSEREGVVPCYRKDVEGAWHWDRTADGYRLPTEAEWEYACRAGTQTRWFWGDEAAGAEAHAWYRGNAEGRLHPVAEKDANPWGLNDLAGLVYEWCWDRYGSYPQDGDQPIADPEGPAEGDSRVVRGGSFVVPPELLRSAFRIVDRPDFRGGGLGLRCVRSRARQP